MGKGLVRFIAFQRHLLGFWAIQKKQKNTKNLNFNSYVVFKFLPFQWVGGVEVSSLASYAGGCGFDLRSANA